MRGRQAPQQPAVAGSGDGGDRRIAHQQPHARAGAAEGIPERFAALDLGTNNCRLLIAAPRGRRFRIIDAYSRIVRLGEGMTNSGALSEAAMGRALGAIRICAEKIAKRGVTRQRSIATQACRAAANGAEFLARVETDTGLRFEIISPAEEARLAVRGCAELFDSKAPTGLVFDIGGGSTELSWVVPGRGRAAPQIAAWVSLPCGVVNLSEDWGGRDMSDETYERLVTSVQEQIRAFGDPASVRSRFNGAAHLIGTSGTVTSIAGVHLGLARYRRSDVDGLWLTRDDVRAVSANLLAMDFATRASEPCIGVERADLVVCGCAILEALLREWPSERIRVGDRGLREGILADLADAARAQRRRSRRARA
jgi:exopolyphosphatase/guanosine-5'-triphosphate,3'-diphosphate pyrophosphatase